MKWTPGGESQDIEDRRDEGGGGGFQFGGMHIGIGGALVLLILSFIFRTNLFTLLGGGTGDPGTAVSQPDPARDAAEKPLVQFVSFVLDDTQKTWTQILPQQTNTPYRHAKLVLFRDCTQSGCGGAASATGPFYCPDDERVYIDLGFFDELSRRFGAPGQFAQAYVLAHELGHHVQKLIGIEGKVHQLQESNSREANPALRETGTSSRLFCGRLGAFYATTRPARKRRRAIGTRCCGCRRRRPPAKNVHGPCQSGIIHARLFPAAYAMVQGRSG